LSLAGFDVVDLAGAYALVRADDMINLTRVAGSPIKASAFPKI